MLIQMQNTHADNVINPCAARRLLLKVGNPPNQIIHDKVENRASSGVEARLMALGMVGLLSTTPKFSTLCHIVSFMLPTTSLLVFPARRRLMIF